MGKQIYQIIELIALKSSFLNLALVDTVKFKEKVFFFISGFVSK